MNPKIDILTEAVVKMENLFEVYNPDDVESVSMLNYSVNSNELMLHTA